MGQRVVVRPLPASGSEFLGGCGLQVSHPNQIVGGCRQGEHPTHSVRPAEFGLALQSHSFQPPKYFLHSFALPLTDGIAAVPGGPLINGTASPGGVLRYMCRHLQIAQGGYKSLGVISTIPTHGDSPGFRFVGQHFYRSIAFRGPGCLRQTHIHHQPIAVLGNDVSQIAQFGFRSPALLVEPRLRVCLRLVRLIGAFLLVPVDVGITAARPWWLSRAVLFLGLKTLLPGPGFYQSPVHRKVLVRQQPLAASLLHDEREELFRHYTLQQPVSWSPGAPFARKVRNASTVARQ